MVFVIYSSFQPPPNTSENSATSLYHCVSLSSTLMIAFLKKIGREKEYVGLPVVGRGKERELGAVGGEGEGGGGRDLMIAFLNSTP